jgi:hypothetical protein
MNIEELKRLTEAATMGPWKVDKWLGARHDDWIVAYDAGDKGRGIAVVDSIYYLSDARCIAVAKPAAILELIRQRDELLVALKDAREMVDDWGAYATAYMQEKHDLAGDLDRLDAAISKVEK